MTKVAKHWKTAGLNYTDHALCVFAEKLTLNPDSMLKKILENWRTWDSLIQRFMMQFRFQGNRVAEALHVEFEVDVRARGK